MDSELNDSEIPCLLERCRTRQQFHHKRLLMPQSEVLSNWYSGKACSHTYHRRLKTNNRHHHESTSAMSTECDITSPLVTSYLRKPYISRDEVGASANDVGGLYTGNVGRVDR